jgi:hypothetical protein
MLLWCQFCQLNFQALPSILGSKPHKLSANNVEHAGDSKLLKEKNLFI